jgi:hypothetical protein
MVVARGTAARTKAKKIRKKHQECARLQKEEMQKAEVEGYFARFDLDKNGILDKEEFPELLKALFGEDAVTIGIDSVVARLVKNCEKQGGITKENVIRAINKYGAFVKEQAAAAKQAAAAPFDALCSTTAIQPSRCRRCCRRPL